MLRLHLRPINVVIFHESDIRTSLKLGAKKLKLKNKRLKRQIKIIKRLDLKILTFYIIIFHFDIYILNFQQLTLVRCVKDA